MHSTANHLFGGSNIQFDFNFGQSWLVYVPGNKQNKNWKLKSIYMYTPPTTEHQVYYKM